MNRAQKFLVVVALSLFAVVAVGANGEVRRLEQYFFGGFFAGSSAAAVASNKVTGTYATTCDCMFPTIPAGYSWTCSNPCALTGPKLGDPCSVGVAKASPSDGGSAMNVNGPPTCDVIRDGIIYVTLHNQFGDGGDLTLPDAGYNVRVISNQ